jgi:hypothetical protein
LELIKGTGSLFSKEAAKPDQRFSGGRANDLANDLADDLANDLADDLANDLADDLGDDLGDDLARDRPPQPGSPGSPGELPVNRLSNQRMELQEVT